MERQKPGFQEKITVNLHYLGHILAYESKLPKANILYVKI
jgi:hypothetical protein